MRGLNLRELEAVAGGRGEPKPPAQPSGVSQFDWDRLLRQQREQQREQQER